MLAIFFIQVARMFTGNLVALVTPFTEQHSIDFESFAALIEWHIQAGTQAIVVAGTTGESATLTDPEKVELAKKAVEVANGRIAIIVGNGSNSTAATIALTQQLNHTGIDGYLTVTPYYNKPTNAGLLAHFTQVAASTSLPIILYNVPSRTACDMQNDVVVKLSELSNIVGIKDATADLTRVDILNKHCHQPFVLLSGDDASAVEFCQRGGHGVISVTANVLPKVTSSVYQYIAHDDFAQAKSVDQKIASFHHALFTESNPIVVKWALCELNKIKTPELRLPLTCISDDAKVALTPKLEELKQYSQES